MLSPITKHKDQNDFIKSLKIAGHTFHYDMTLDYSIEIEAAQREREREREREKEILCALTFDSKIGSANLDFSNKQMKIVILQHETMI